MLILNLPNPHRSKANQVYNTKETLSNSPKNKSKIKRSWNKRFYLLTKANPRSTIQSLPANAFKLMDKLLEASASMSTVFFSQEKLAEYVDMGTRTVQRMLYYLESIGLISIENRDYQTCIYTINPI